MLDQPRNSVVFPRNLLRADALSTRRSTPSAPISFTTTLQSSGILRPNNCVHSRLYGTSWRIGLRRRPEHAVAAGARVEKGQYLSFARQFYCRGLGRRASGQKTLEAPGSAVTGISPACPSGSTGLDARPLLAHKGRTPNSSCRGHFNGRAPKMRISTSLRALCCQSGLVATLATPIKARSRSMGSRSFRISPLLIARLTRARMASHI